MSRADYPYPDDEFDAAGGADVPRGVHREPRTGWSRWWPFVLVIVLAPLLAFGLVTLYTHQGGGDSSDDTGQVADDTPTTTATGTATATSPAPAETRSTPAKTTPASTVNLDAPVAILNGAKIQGLAGRQATKLKDAGFTKVTTGNSTGTLPASSTVYYATDELQATAQKVADTLGIDAVVQDAGKAGTSITVVLTSDPDA